MIGLAWIILLPMLAALVAPLWPKRWRNAPGWWATAVSASVVALLASFGPAISEGQPIRFSLPWPAPELGVQLALGADGWGWGFALVVAGIGTLICLYAVHYLSDEEPRSRFFAYLLLFEGAMLGVVLSSNLLFLVVFWELTSVASFLLIGFWHRQERARYGAYKALLITGIGGLGLLAGVVLLYLAMGTFDLYELIGRADEVQAHPWFVPILVLVLLGVFTKSAQFPFHLWLPDAMTAPTPVSAYLHSATMVKAGVFLLGRIHPVFRGREEWFWIVTTIGMATMLLGAYAAVRKTDLKALLAYSTISQLGLITMLYGFGTHTAALAATFHIFNHAAFKAGLFLVVGIVDHETGTRDKRRLGGLAKAMPVTMVICGACALASAGVPLLNGFLSKELFYTEMVQVGTRGWVWTIWPALAIGGSIFTFVYSMEVFHGVFFGQLRMHDTHQEHAPHKPHDPSWGMLVPAGLLATVCVLVGLWPGVLEGWLLKPAVWAVWQQVFDFHVVVWHGFTTPLILSILTMVAGVVLYLQRHRLGQVQERFAWRFTANTIYDGALNGLIGSTGWLTNKLQNGQLRQYLWYASAVLVAAMLYAAAPAWGAILPSQFSAISGWETAILVLLILAALAVVWRNGERLSAVITVGSVGLLISGLYLVMSAPDLALTQLLVESVTIILFLFVLWRLPQDTPRSSPRRHRVSDAVLSIVFGGLICLLVLGVSASEQLWALPEYFIGTSLPEAGGRNIVNVILVDFRGFDTLGEITVLGIAALGAFALLRLRNGKERDR